jgi:hypothetical protein
MIEENLKRILRERRYLFRGTNTHAFEKSKTGSGYAGFINHAKKEQVNHTTPFLGVAISYAAQRIKSDFPEEPFRQGRSRHYIDYSEIELRPVLMAIDCVPYLERIRVGLEGDTGFSEKGIFVPLELEITGEISNEDIELIETIERLEFFAGKTMPQHKIRKLINMFKANFKK